MEAASDENAKRRKLEVHTGFVESILMIMQSSARMAGTPDSQAVAGRMQANKGGNEKVLDNRFLLGADDGSYLRQGVMPLQTSNPNPNMCDDEYSLAPSDDSFTMMQDAARMAVVQAMKEELEKRIQALVNNIKPLVHAIANLFGQEPVRNGTLRRAGTKLTDPTKDIVLGFENNPKLAQQQLVDLVSTVDGREVLLTIANSINLDKFEEQMINGATGVTGLTVESVKHLRTQLEASMQLDKEMQTLKDKNSTSEGKKAFTSDNLARTRRTVIWNDALREACVSGDRLFAFVRQLSGVIHEQVDAVCVIDENLLVQHQNKLRDRRSRIAERAAQEHMQLVKAVFSAVMRESGLVLGIESGKTEKGDLSKLKVVSNTLRKQIADLAQGQGQEGFFGNSVRMEHLLASGTGEITLEDLFARLQAVGKALQSAVSSATSDDQPFNSVSMDFLSAPRNSMMLRYKPEALAAIKQAFEIFQREFGARFGSMMTPISAYELMEGNDDTLSTHFATFAAHMLVHSRMFGSSTAMYVGQWASASNAQVLKISLERLCRSAYAYRQTTSSPNYSSAQGRTAYFRGAASRQSKLFVLGGASGPSGMLKTAYHSPRMPSLLR